MNDLGGTTDRISPLDRPIRLAIERDQRLRRFGIANYAAGISICVADVIAALSTAFATENGAFHTSAGRLFGNLVYVILMVLGAALIVVGATLTMHAHDRQRDRDTNEQILSNRRRLDQAIAETHEINRSLSQRLDTLTVRLDRILPVVASLPERLEGIEKVIDKVPAFGEGVILGAEMRKSILPDDQ